METKYILTSDGELYHWSWGKKAKEKEDHKYIKREWKNGKWVYTYPTDNKKLPTANLKKSAPPKADPKKISSVYERGSKVISGARKTIDTSPKVSEENNKEKSILGKIADFLGFDDREERENARRDAIKANTVSAIATTNYNSTRNNAAADYNITVDERKRIDEAKSMTEAAAEQVVKAGEAYIRENEEYLQTPLGKAEKFLSDGIAFVANLFGIGESEYDKLKKQAEENEADRAAQQALDYAEEQTEERNGERASELKRLLETLTKPNTWFETNNPLPDLALKQSATTMDDDMRLINPNYSPDQDSLYNENCAYCAIAYDLRRRGYDVQAAAEVTTSADSNPGLTALEIAELYGVKTTVGQVNCWNSVTTTSDMQKDMLSCGDGARGIMTFSWTQGGGHAIVWEVDDGEVTFRDCQTGKIVKFSDYASLSREMHYMRTDDKTPSEDVLEYVKNREG